MKWIERLLDPKVWVAAAAAYAVTRRDDESTTWPSSHARAASNALARAPYVGGGPFDPARCASSPTPATRLLGGSIRDVFPGTRLEYLNCNALRDEMTLHAVGRAIDAFPTSMAVGNELANWLVENAEVYDIQLIIWNRVSWQRSKSLSTRFAPYTGSNPHTNHAHVEVSV